MLEPGGKNWISKYFELVQKNTIELSIPELNGINKNKFLHSYFFPTGISFGYAAKFLFSNNIESSRWTQEERLKLLLFEAHILIYLSANGGFNEPDFTQKLLAFYNQYEERKSFEAFKFLRKENDIVKLEGILSRRVHVKRTFANMFWVSYLSNGLVYLDVIGFKAFLSNKENSSFSYQNFASAVVKTIVIATYADGVIEPQEQSLLSVIFASSGLSSSEKDKIIQSAENNSLTVQDLNLSSDTDGLFKYYLLDLAILAIYSDQVAEERELTFIHNLYKYLKIPNVRLNESVMLIERFILENDHRVSFLQMRGSYDRIYASFSRRWIKILGRNKEKLAVELKQNKELIALVNKSLVRELSPEEKEKVKTQFFDLIKTMPALAIFMLPGGALLLPIILKIIPDLIPSSFRQNKLDE